MDPCFGFAHPRFGCCCLGFDFPLMTQQYPAKWKDGFIEFLQCGVNIWHCNWLRSFWRSWSVFRNPGKRRGWGGRRHLHCYGYEKHIAGFDHQIARIAHPDVERVIHEEQRAGDESWEDGQTQLSEEIPVDLDVAHGEGSQSSWKQTRTKKSSFAGRK